MRNLIIFFFLALFLFSCSNETNYILQFHNKTSFKLDSVSTRISGESARFQLGKNEKSEEISLLCKGTAWVGPHFLYCSVEKYVINDSLIKYSYGNLQDVSDLIEDKTNLIEIVIDSTKLSKEIEFRFELKQ